MSTLEKYTKAFVDTFEVTPEVAIKLSFQDIPAWDSVGHMGLVAALEETFDIMMDTDDIFDLSSFEKGKEILAKYDVEIS